jgi:ribosomal protein S18 acetylase RimI-like enzyme
MDVEHVRALYDLEVRARPQAQPGIVVERVGDLVRITGPFNFISTWSLTAETAPEAIADQIDYSRNHGLELLWRVYDHDQPTGLSGLLKAAGLSAHPSETLMLFDLADEIAAPAGVEVRRARTLDELDAFVRIGGQAFGAEESWRRDAYAERLDDPDLGLYVAYADGVAAASARLEMSADWSFGLLMGGGVAPEHRGGGLYRALVAARAAEARARGLKYLASDARETSRPILQRLGFAPAGRAQMWASRP